VKKSTRYGIIFFAILSIPITVLFLIFKDINLKLFRRENISKINVSEGNTEFSITDTTTIENISNALKNAKKSKMDPPKGGHRTVVLEFILKNGDAETVWVIENMDQGIVISAAGSYYKNDSILYFINRP
jgi:hypothetical protein